MTKIESEDGEYNPFDHRPPDQTTSTTLAVFFHLLKAGMGSGVLFLPYAFRKTGYVAGFVCSIFIAIIGIHTAVITVQCGQILCKRARVPSLDFAETAETSFKLGPERLRKYATAFKNLTNIIVCFVQYETTIVYGLYIATSMKQIIEYFTEAELDIRVYIAAFLPIFCLFSLIPNFTYLMPFSLIGTTFLILCLCATFYYFFVDFPSPSRMKMLTDVEEIPIFCSVFLFALYNMSMIMPLENTMRHTKKLPVVIAATMIINTSICLAFGFLGYNKYLNACDTIIKNLPLDEALSQTVKFTIVLAILCTYGLQYYIPITILWPMIATKIGDNRWYERIFRLGGVLACTLLSLAVPHLAPLLGLFAALCVTTVMLLIPIIIEFSTKWNEPKHNFMIVKNIFIGIVWLILLISGTYENMRIIIREYGGSEDV